MPIPESAAAINHAPSAQGAVGVRQPWLGTGSRVILTTCGLALTALVLLPAALRTRLISEGGFIENLTAAILGAGVILAGLKLKERRSGVWLSITFVLLWMFMRELDYQRMFTPRSIESTGFYRSSAITLQMKLVAFGALLPFGMAGLYLLRAAILRIRAAKLPRSAWERISVAVVLVAAALISEKLLPPAFQALEEVAEAGFAAVIVLAVAQARRRSTDEVHEAHEEKN
ncbi:MAG TPA: hypothetical protein VEH27_00100 [Methylomirabilota bacterium]|nr:hypothetical protein [Methylomirabilota bacterium]